MNIADIANIIQEARQDKDLLSTIDAEELLKSIDKVKNDFLENHTFDTIATEVFHSLIQLQPPKPVLESVFQKLAGYRFVPELHLLHRGKFVRWIRHDKPEILIRGGIVVDIQFGDFGVNILCRLMNGTFIKYRFDKCHTYQKLTEEECLILSLYSNVK